MAGGQNAALSGAGGSQVLLLGADRSGISCCLGRHARSAIKGAKDPRRKLLRSAPASLADIAAMCIVYTKGTVVACSTKNPTVHPLLTQQDRQEGSILTGREAWRLLFPLPA
ncbi:hypothetical protein N7466_003687 [Penicillium verhagenii]|uniref:uncharacterized protein n=1 Tax=Penicillium verhagenii TaxID=1562060 RepID=UPI0025455AD5|nr:uncharacterized protein N7466_003687 [Penicillium verhagenii]KAJ5934140.1 hypothetical protein N7466_003687 [Penicillium verhagenii]